MIPTPGAPALAAELTELEHIRSDDVLPRLERARRLEAEARAAGDAVAEQRARLVVADMLHRVGQVPESATLASEVHAWAEAHGERLLLARSHLVLSSVFGAIGDAPSSLDHAVRAVDLVGDDVAPRERGTYLRCLADALAIVGSADEARRRYAEALAAFTEAGDTERQLTILNNVIVLEGESGELRAAADAADVLATKATSRAEMNPCFAETIARARLGVGDAAGAEAALALGFTLLHEQGDNQAATPAELLLTQAELNLAQGDLPGARAALAACLDVCRDRDLGALRVEALRVSAEISAAAGDHKAAYEAHRTFHAEAMARRGRQEEAAARTRHAVFETAEARRAAERFWRQARTDPLTDLHNRRHVDEALPALLGLLPAPGRVTVAAIVDIDHFKAINDEHTHAVGDRVLVQLGVLLRDAAGGAGGRSIAARLGGEEFLLVREAAERDPLAPIEVFRRRVAAFDWTTVASRLRVTVSAGVAVARPDDTQFTLLGRADQHLYQAKRSGRDRVVGDASPGPFAAR